MLDYEEFVECVVNGLISNSMSYLSEKYKEFINENSKSNKVELFAIGKRTGKTKVVCSNCRSLGRVNSKCSKCGGKGVHHKSYEYYYIKSQMAEIDKIDRDKETGTLRYWTDKSSFFYETTPSHNDNVPYEIHYIHFSLDDARLEVNRLNRILSLIDSIPREEI